MALPVVVGSLGACGDSAEDGGETNGSSGTIQAGLTKGSPGANVGDSDFCGTSSTSRCTIGQGDCDADQQCQSGLVCVPGNLAKRGTIAGDACAPLHCRDGVKNVDETSIDCGGSCGWNCTVACDAANGSAGKCSTDCPCSVGEGQCTDSAQCAAGLECGSNNGSLFQLASGTNACWAATCQNSQKDGDETAVDCGGSCAPCAPPAAGPVALVTGGTPLPIVIAPHSDPSVHLAIVTIANDLRDKLNAIKGPAGQAFVVQPPSNTASGISLGIHGDFPNTGWPYQGFFRPNDSLVGGIIRPERLGLKEHYILRTPQGSNRVIVAGATVDALQAAVWDLLAQAGYRHYFPTPTWEVIPRVPSLSLNLAIEERPAFFSRTLGFPGNTWETQFATTTNNYLNEWRKHNRLQNGTTTLTPVGGYGTVVTWWQNKYGATFPSELSTDPAQNQHSRQFCLSGVATVGGNQWTVESVIRAWAAEQTTPTLSLSPNANTPWASAVKPNGSLNCNDISHPTFGSVANRMVAIVNAAAESQPTKLVLSNLRYDFSEAPTLALRQNVVVNLHSQHAAATPFALENRLRDWGRAGFEVGVTDQLGITNPELPGQVELSTQFIVDRIKTFYGLGARRYDVDVNWGFGLAGPTWWAAARGFWDVDNAVPPTASSYRADFLVNAFGPAAAAMSGYYSVLEGRALWSSNLVGVMYRSLRDGFAATNDQEHAAIRARLADLAVYTRFLELSRKFWNRCDAQSPETEQSQLKQLLRFTYATRDRRILESRDAMAEITSAVANCVNNIEPTTGPACDLLEWGVNCPTPTQSAACGSCFGSSSTCNAMKQEAGPTQGELIAIVNNGAVNVPVLEPSLVRQFSKDLVPYDLQPSTLPPRLESIYTKQPHHLIFQRAITAGAPTAHVRKNGASQILSGRLSLLRAPEHALEHRFFPQLGSEIETDWVFPSATGEVYRLDLDDQGGRMFTTFPAGTRVAVPVGADDPPLALNYRWQGYMFVPAGTGHVVGWSQGDGTFFRNSKTANGSWLTHPAGYLSDFAVGSACTNPHDIAGGGLNALWDHFVIPVSPPAPTDELWYFNDGSAGTVGERVLLSVPPYLYQAPDRLLVPKEVTPNNGKAPCNVTSDCAQGAYCAGGVCHVEGESCTNSNQCSPGQTCQNQTCGGTGGLGDACVDGSCAPDLVCGTDNGRAFDKSPGRYCWSGSCDLGSADAWCGTLQSPCGKCMSDPGTPTCQPQCAGKVCGDNSDDGCGGTCALCGEREGECHKDAECEVGLVCGQGAGTRFGLVGIEDACWRPVCESLKASEVPCGSASATCGSCPACQPQCQGKEYGDDGCGGSCGQCAPGEWEGPNFECFGALSLKSSLPNALAATDYVTQGTGTIEGDLEVTNRGEAQYTVPLVLPPGRAGLEPNLALTYNSAAGNGDLGQGWSLSGLHRITRCPETISQDGISRGTKDSLAGGSYQSGALCLNGARLIRIAGSNAELEFRTEIDTGVKVVAANSDDLNAGFLAYYSDGRIATFAHPDLQSDAPPLEDIWVLTRVEDRAGNYMTVEHDARKHGRYAILRPKKVWYTGHIDGTAPDTLVEFHYERRPDITSGFRDGIVFLNDDILKKISVSLGELPVREYRLEQTALRAGGASMLTRLEECVPTFEGGTDFVCKPPTKFDYEEDAVGLTEGIPIGFHPNAPGSAQFDVIPDLPLDMDGDGVDDLLMVVLDAPPGSDNPNSWDKHVEILMSARKLENVNVNAAADLVIPVDVYNLPEIFNVIDYDLDGRDDLLMEHPIAPGNYSVLTYKNHGFDVVDLGITSSLRRPPGYTGETNNRTYVLDVDGDGVRDIVKCNSAPPSKGDSFWKGPWTWTLAHLPDLTERPIDFNGACAGHYIATALTGSGRESLLIKTHAYLEGSDEVTRKDSYLAISFEDAEFGKEGIVHTQVRQTDVPVSRSEAGLALDANGDGLTDILVYKGSGDLQTWLGTGRGDLFEFDYSAPHNYLNGENDAKLPSRLLTPTGGRYVLGPVLDVNGDGRDDVMIADRSKSTWEVLTSSVEGVEDARYRAFSGWRVEQLASAPPTTWTNGVMAGRGVAMDVNGDGIKDFVQKPTGGFSPANLAAYVRTGPQVSKLVAVENGLGSRIEVEYANASHPLWAPHAGDPLLAHFSELVYAERDTFRDTCNYELGLVCPPPRRALVKRHREFQGASSQSELVREFTHSYEDERIGLNGRGNLGFAFHRVDDEGLGHVSFSYFDNLTRDPTTGAFPYAGREYKHLLHSPIGDDAGIRTSIREVEFDFRRSPVSDAVLLPYAHVVTEVLDESEPFSWPRIGEVTHTIEIDEYGNQLSIVSEWSGRGRIEQETRTNTYAHESRPEFVADWLVNLPETQTITSSGIAGESEQAEVSRTTAFDYYDNGLLERTVVEPTRPAYLLSSKFGRDDYGNVSSVDACPGVVECAAAVKRTSTIDYESRNIFPELKIDSEGYQTELEHRHDLGLVTKVIEHGKTGSRTLTSYSVHDGFGRVRVEQQPDGRMRKASFETAPRGLQVVTTIDGGPTTTILKDELGRSVKRGATSLNGTEFVAESGYDVFGRVNARSRQREGTITAADFAEYDYDLLGRTTFISEPGGSAQTSVCYLGPISCVIDTDDKIRCLEEDYRGRTLFAGDPVSLNQQDCLEVAETFGETEPDQRSGVAYRYGPFSQLEQAIRMPEGTVVTKLTSDRLGRPESRMDVGSGITSFTHTQFGELETLNDSNSLVTFSYDKLGRRRTRTVDPSAPGEATTTIEWIWREDLPNRLDYKTSNGVETIVDYDDFGRVGEVTQSLDGEDFTTSIDEYDSNGRPRFVTYPGDVEFRIENVYDPASGVLREIKSAPTGQQTSTTSYWKLDDLDEFGQAKSESLGNGLVTTRTYHDFTGLPKTVITRAPSKTPVQDVTYAFHDTRNLKSVVDANGLSRTYTYDEFGRVDHVLDGTTLLADFEYTTFGSIHVNAKGWTYSYDSSSPHSVDEIEDDSSNRSSFYYNDNGTLRHRSEGALPELNVEYTDFQKPRRIWNGDEQLATTYDYDADENKVAKRTPTTTTIFFGKLYYREEDASGQRVHHYLVSNGKSVVAEVVGTAPSGGGAEQRVTHYLHSDRLGSIQVVTDKNGGVVERQEFDVFGETSTSASVTTRLGYTGHWQEPESSLVDMGGRFYDPQVGQFLSSDPVLGQQGRGESFNSKAYVSNNPLRFTDPSGFQMCDELSFCPGWLFKRPEPRTAYGLAPVVGTFSAYNPSYSPAKFVDSGAAAPSSVSDTVSDLVDGVTGALSSSDVETRVSAQLTLAGLGANVVPYVGDYAALWFSVVNFGSMPSWSSAGDVGLDVVGAILPGLPSMGTARRAAVLAASGVAVGGTAILAKAARSAARISKTVKCYGKCMQFASRLQQALKRQGIAGIRLRIERQGAKIADIRGAGTLVGDDIHEAIRVGDTVFDNLNPDGIPYEIWRDSMRFLDDLDTKIADDFIDLKHF